MDTADMTGAIGAGAPDIALIGVAPNAPVLREIFALQDILEHFVNARIWCVPDAVRRQAMPSFRCLI